jgi:hypothetical protein
MVPTHKQLIEHSFNIRCLIIILMLYLHLT